MDGRFSHPFVKSDLQQHEDPRFILEVSDSPPFSGVVNDEKFATTPSPRKGRRALQKRVVSVPIGDVDGSRLKGEGAPPSDSWAWRKYGQKPIKGSPYP
ncbi:Wrky transcription factor, partial [Thalictrum thalictroides]